MRLITSTFALALLTVLAAKSDLVSVGSSNTHTRCVVGGITCTTVEINAHPAWVPPLAGTSWISVAQTGWPLSVYAPNGFVVEFTHTVRLAGGSTVMVTWAADDSSALWVNDTLVVPEASQAGNTYSTCSDFEVTCRYHTLTDVSAYVVDGDNVFKWWVYQRAGYAFGLNYDISASQGVPEPSYRVCSLAVLLWMVGWSYMRHLGGWGSLMTMEKTTVAIVWATASIALMAGLAGA